jgi:hypothetical protein
MLLPKLLGNAREPISTTILTQPRVSVQPGSSIEEVGGCRCWRFGGAALFSVARLAPQSLSVVCWRGLIDASPSGARVRRAMQVEEGCKSKKFDQEKAEEVRSRGDLKGVEN